MLIFLSPFNIFLSIFFNLIVFIELCCLFTVDLLCEKTVKVLEIFHQRAFTLAESWHKTYYTNFITGRSHYLEIWFQSLYGTPQRSQIRAWVFPNVFLLRSFWIPILVLSVPWDYKNSVPRSCPLLLAFSPLSYMFKIQQMHQWRKQVSNLVLYVSFSQGSWHLYFWLPWQPETSVIISSFHFHEVA